MYTKEMLESIKKVEATRAERIANVKAGIHPRRMTAEEKEQVKASMQEAPAPKAEEAPAEPAKSEEPAPSEEKTEQAPETPAEEAPASEASETPAEEPTEPAEEPAPEPPPVEEPQNEPTQEATPEAAAEENNVAEIIAGLSDRVKALEAALTELGELKTRMNEYVEKQKESFGYQSNGGGTHKDYADMSADELKSHILGN